MAETKVILIAGASSQIGVLLCQNLLAKGCKVYGGYYSRPFNINQKNFKTLKLDILNEKSCQQAVETIFRTEGRLDAVINLVGATMAGPAESLSVSDLQRLLEVNVVGAFRLIRAVLPRLRQQGHGKIIMTSSLSGFIALPNFGLYSASKFALEALMQSLYLENSKIQFVTISPGAFTKKTTSDKSELPHKTLRQKLALVNYIFPITSAEEVVETYLKVLANPNPPSRIIVGRDALVCYLVMKFLPNQVFNGIIKLLWRKK